MNTIIKWSIVKPDLGTKFIAEFLGCMLFHFTGSIAGTPEANAVALATLVYFTAKLSGAHLNPVVSCIFNVLGHINPVELFVYIAAQILGCITGALWLALLVPWLNLGSGEKLPCDGCFLPFSELSSLQIVGFEAIGTFSFVLPVFSVVWYTQNKLGYGNVGPIMVGLSLLTAAYTLKDFTGAALNPARVLSSYVIFQCMKGTQLGLYIAGEFLGAFIAVICIALWYGISDRSWYLLFVNEKIQRFLQSYQPSIQIQTHDKKQLSRYVETGI